MMDVSRETVTTGLADNIRDAYIRTRCLMTVKLLL